MSYYSFKHDQYKSLCVHIMPLKEEKDKFLLVSKRILKQDLSTNTETLIKHKDDIIIAYTKFVNYCNSIYTDDITESSRAQLTESLNYIARKFEECLIRLNCKYVLSANLLDLPNVNKIKLIGIEIDDSQLETF